jgi:hypothetical protein
MRVIGSDKGVTMNREYIISGIISFRLLVYYVRQG